MAVGVARFNFTITVTGYSPDTVKQIILDRLAGSGIDVAPNTLSVQIDPGIPADLKPPPLPGFNQIHGSIRHKP